jgi:hypothetical protein
MIPEPEQVKRLESIVDKMLAGRSRRVKMPAVKAFVKALASVSPSDEHGQLLLTTLRSLKEPPGIVTDDYQRAVWWLARQGQTPTAEAVSAKVDETRTMIKRRLEIHAQVNEILSRDGCRAAKFTADYCNANGYGPTWDTLATAMGWNMRVRHPVITGFRAQGWLNFTDRRRSLVPGYRYEDAVKDGV